jgi:hypothetical protein
MADDEAVSYAHCETCGGLVRHHGSTCQRCGNDR